MNQPAGGAGVNEENQRGTITDNKYLFKTIISRKHEKSIISENNTIC